MKTTIEEANIDWKLVKNLCRNTMNKDSTGIEPCDDFIKKILIAEHSPIRVIRIRWNWKDIKSWISVHFARHWLGWNKWISTQRTDRTGIERNNLPQDAKVDMVVEANAQALINVSRVRLCYQAANETREYMEDLKDSIYIKDKNLSNVLVPNCVYRGGCSEITPCGFYKKGKNTRDFSREMNCHFT